MAAIVMLDDIQIAVPLFKRQKENSVNANTELPNLAISITIRAMCHRADID